VQEIREDIAKHSVDRAKEMLDEELREIRKNILTLLKGQRRGLLREADAVVAQAREVGDPLQLLVALDTAAFGYNRAGDASKLENCLDEILTLLKQRPALPTAVCKEIGGDPSPNLIRNPRLPTDLCDCSETTPSL
jgi:hypothetical protein